MFNIFLIIHKDTWLVVEPTPLKSMKVNRDDDIPNLCRNKTCSSHHQPAMAEHFWGEHFWKHAGVGF